MFMVRLAPNADPRYCPLTVRPSEYLYDFAAFIARSIPDVEVHAHLGHQHGDAVVFKGQDLHEEDVELF